ncbi:hypothetical protein [Bradyrhizobium sp. BTAi1]|jgi:hypothetical protein|uniref:hypothetical protein n=1 Tax=Bradyrhizobium sp. (strain BTAi1 / ATCC BAA-1182) TaxID=288000 RepID=UPI0005A1EA0E|nr:hypothetical protein [Bradyrhizobium sp. BTAi1]
MTRIATRTFELDGFTCVEAVSRTGEQSFVLQFSSDHPAEAPFERTMTLAEVFEWLRDQPQQIAREVVIRK